MPDITLEAGSPSERMAAHLRDNPGAVLDRVQIVRVLGCAPGAVDAALRPAVNLGLITLANDSDAGRVWRAGPRLAQWRPSWATEIAPNAADAIVAAMAGTSTEATTTAKATPPPQEARQQAGRHPQHPAPAGPGQPAGGQQLAHAARPLLRQGPVAARRGVQPAHR